MPPLFLQESGHSGGMRFGREASQISHSGVFSFWWNWIIPEFTLEWSQEWCSPEWAGMEFHWNSAGFRSCIYITIQYHLFISDG